MVPRMKWPGYMGAMLLTFGFSGCVSAPEPMECRDEDLIDFAPLAPNAIIRMRYATMENFVGTVVDGYEAPRCLLTTKAAKALASVEIEAERAGLRLVIFDCYRPQRAVDHFLRWSRDSADQVNKALYYPDEPKETLFERGYIARLSGHSRGSTVDLSLAAKDGSLLEMGTEWDFMDPASATDSPQVTLTAQSNRLQLRRLLEAQGFANYPAEWWHYTLENEPYPSTYFNRTID